MGVDLKGIDHNGTLLNEGFALARGPEPTVPCPIPQAGMTSMKDIQQGRTLQRGMLKPLRGILNEGLKMLIAIELFPR